jgi:hypothetical protein
MHIIVIVRRKEDDVAQALIDHDRIREWAEARGGAPASVRGTGRAGDPGLLRIDMAGGAGNESLQRISWDDWFRKFDAQQLALVIDDADRPSTFNKLVSRHDVNIDTNPAERRRDAGSKESNMAKPNRQTDRSRAATETDDPNTEHDVMQDTSDDSADVDEVDDDTDESDDEFEDVETEDESDDDDLDDGNEDEDEDDESKDDDRG